MATLTEESDLLPGLFFAGLQSGIDDELAFHSDVTCSAPDATLERVGAGRLRDKFNG